MQLLTARNNGVITLDNQEFQLRSGWNYITTNQLSHSLMGVGELSTFINDKELLEPTDYTGKKLLVSRTGGLGDFFFIMRSIMEIKKKYEGVTVDFCCAPKYIEFVKNIFYPTLLNSVNPILIKYPMYEACNYFFTFEGYIEANREALMFNAFDLMAKKFFVDIGLDHTVPVKLPPLYIEKADTLSKEWTRPVVGMQLRASSIVRTYPVKDQEKIVQWLDMKGYNTLLLDTPMNIAEVMDQWSAKTNKSVVLPYSASIKPSMLLSTALVPHCKLLFVPDSVFVYLGDSFNVPTIAIYSVVHSSLRALGLNTYALEMEGGCQNCGLQGGFPCKWSVDGWAPCLKSLKAEHLCFILEGLLDGDKIFSAPEPDGSCPDRLFTYAAQLNIDDLEGIIGIEGACKFIKVFAGVSLRFPSFKSIQRALRDTMIRYEYKQLKEYQNSKKIDIYEILADKYKLYDKRTAYNIIKNYGRSNKLMRDMIKARDIKLLELIGKYSEILKTYGFI